MSNNKLDQIAKFAYSTKETLLFTYLTTCKLIRENIEGSFVECGVGAGAQIAAMILACKETNNSQKIWGFDSFQGIPLAGTNDKEQPGIGIIKHDINLPERQRLISSGITVHSKFNVIDNFIKLDLKYPDLFLIEGWFQDTIKEYAHNEYLSKISLLRLDGDLYESTMPCLEHLYPLVVKGGVIIIDDNLSGVTKALHDYFGDNMPDIKYVEGTEVRYFVK